MKIDLKQLDFVEPLIKSIVLDAEHHFRVEFTITSIYRPDGAGVHSTLPVRGIDISCPDNDFGLIIEKYANSKYQYDPDRPHMKVCIYHDTGSGYHCHFQCHPNTVVNNQ